MTLSTSHCETSLAATGPPVAPPHIGATGAAGAAGAWPKAGMAITADPASARIASLFIRISSHELQLFLAGQQILAGQRVLRGSCPQAPRSDLHERVINSIRRAHLSRLAFFPLCPRDCQWRPATVPRGT